MQSLAEEMTGQHGVSAGSSDSRANRAFAASRLPEALRARWPEWCTLSFYAALVAIAIPYHEPWADEAQAWQLARNLSLSDLFKTYIRYEGSPGLWHFLLWVLNRAHVSYSGMHWICGVIAVGAASLLVFASPFPRYLRLTLPFTYFLLFQYAVIARSYVLAPLLLFLVAVCWKRNPLILAVVLGLLANTAIHAAIISGGLAIVYTIGHLRNESFKSSIERRRLFLSASVVLIFYAFAIWTAKPPHDIGFKTSSGSVAISTLFRLLELCQPFGLGILFWVAMGLWFAAKRKLLYLLPALLCAGFCVAVYGSWWHVGLLFPLIVTLLWITWTSQAGKRSRREIAGLAALIAMAGLQIAWSGYALVFDHHRAFSPDAATASYLRPYVQQGAKIVVTYADENTGNAFNTVGILPYFDRNIYTNVKYPFWWWSNRDATEEQFNRLLPTHPRIVMVEAVFKGQVDRIPIDEPKYKTLTQAGYRYTNTFCGTLPERLAPGLTNCHVIFEYPAGPS